jgi:hypothetical protein
MHFVSYVCVCVYKLQYVLDGRSTHIYSSRYINACALFEIEFLYLIFGFDFSLQLRFAGGTVRFVPTFSLERERNDSRFLSLTARV